MAIELPTSKKSIYIESRFKTGSLQRFLTPLQDSLIPLAQSRAFQQEMQRSNNDCEVVPFPQVTHDFLLAPPEMAEREAPQWWRSAAVLEEKMRGDHR